MGPFSHHQVKMFRIGRKLEADSNDFLSLARDEHTRNLVEDARQFPMSRIRVLCNVREARDTVIVAQLRKETDYALSV